MPWKRVVAAVGLGCGLISGCARTPEARLARFMAAGQRHFERKDYARAILDFQNAVRLAPTNPEPYYRLGLTHLETGNLRAGVSYLMKATELDPKHVGAQLKLAQLMATSRRTEILEEAARRAQAALAVAPEDAAVVNTVALTELRLGNAEDARRRLHQLLEKFPGELNASVLLAKIKLRENDLAGAESVLKEAVARAPRAPEPLLALTDLYVVTDRPDLAERQLLQALNAAPDHGPALLRLGELQLRSGRLAQAAETFKRLSALPDKAYRPAYALFLFHQGKTAEAVGELERLYRLDPSDRDVRSRLVAGYLLANRMPEAEKVLSEAIARNPRDVQALLQRGAIWVRSGKLAEAEQDLIRVLRLEPDSAEAHYHLAFVRRANGETAAAKQELSEAVRLNPLLLPARLELAATLLRENSAKAAGDLLDAAPAPHKNELNWIVARNWAFIAQRDFSSAREGVRRGLALARTSELLTQDGNLRLQAKDLAGARASLEEALRLNPENLAALELLALSFTTQGQPAAALARLRKHASEHPDSLPVQTYLGDWLIRLGQSEEARAVFSSALAANPKAVLPALRLAQLDGSQGKADSARKILNSLLEADSRRHEAHFLLGALETQAGNYKAAIAHYRKVVEAQPQNALALNNLAYLLVEHANQPDEGLQLAQRAKELAPKLAAVDDTIGWAYYRKGLYGTAIQYLERAALGSEGTALRKYHLAAAYWRAGQRAKARALFEEVRALDPKLVPAKSIEELWGDEAAPRPR